MACDPVCHFRLTCCQPNCAFDAAQRFAALYLTQQILVHPNRVVDIHKVRHHHGLPQLGWVDTTTGNQVQMAFLVMEGPCVHVARVA